MTRCDTCGEHRSTLSTCQRCGGSFCTSHRLPERHDCPGLPSRDSAGGFRFEDLGDDREQVKHSRSRGASRLLVGLVLLVAVLATGVPPGLVNPAQVPGGQEVAGEVADVLAGPNGTASPGEPRSAAPGGSSSGRSAGGSELNRSRLEYAVHERINDVRENHGLPPLRFDTELRGPARYHSREMAKNGYFAHESPSGETVRDRYERFDYECRVPTSGGRYATGGENIALTWYEEPVRTDNGTAYYSSVDGLAEGAVRQWMNSPGHRENLLREFWRNEAIGVAVTDVDGKTAVYLTQNFC